MDDDSQWHCIRSVACPCGQLIRRYDNYAALLYRFTHGEGEAQMVLTEEEWDAEPDTATRWIESVHAYERRAVAPPAEGLEPVSRQWARGER